MTLPGWLEALPDAAQQRELDRWAIEERGIRGLDLMEWAGSGLADLVAARAPTGRVTIVCGKGNNGGDGYVAARVLREWGREVQVVTLVDPGELRGDARINYERLPGAPPQPFEPGGLSGASGIVDAILGTGFSGEPREPASSAIEAINAARAAGRGRTIVIACDVPSGVDASTGEVAGVAVHAHATATFHAAKPGLWIEPGKSLAGEVKVVDIGIPAGGPGEPEIGLIGGEVLDAVPRRGAAANKFAAGSVLVCGGSTGLTGAPCLASEGAMRAGAGYVTACVPASLNPVFEAHLLEVMTVPLPDVGGALTEDVAEVVLERSGRAQALVLGPGMGREAGTRKLAQELASSAELPLLIDADGLNAHAGELARLASRKASTVLTPHAGELGRLLEIGSSAVQAKRLASARKAAAAAKAVVVLKGDDTLVADPRGPVGISRGGAPSLATAGTGDVLSGVIGAYLAKRMDPFDAACAGVFVHVAAGRVAAGRVGSEGVIASDVIEALPEAFDSYTRRLHATD
jgi:NAD(P)H-hydrate epimerase